MEGIMSTNAISASNQINLATLFGGARVSRKHGDDSDRDSSSGGSGPGITLNPLGTSVNTTA
jgi:hypothetical protein